MADVPREPSRRPGRAAALLRRTPAVPFSTPAYPFDASRMTPRVPRHVPRPAVDPSAAGLPASDRDDIDAAELDADGLDADDLHADDLDADELGSAGPDAYAPFVLGGVLRSDSPFLDAMPALLPLAPDPVEEDEEPADEPAEARPFDREAVERARARAARPAERVEATVASDDGVAEHVCDVSAWLEGATVRELEALAAAGWGGDEALELAEALAEDDPEVADVLRHAARADVGVTVEIDGARAARWLAAHRPDVAERLGLDD